MCLGIVVIAFNGMGEEEIWIYNCFLFGLNSTLFSNMICIGHALPPAVTHPTSISISPPQASCPACNIKIVMP